MTTISDAIQNYKNISGIFKGAGGDNIPPHGTTHAKNGTDPIPQELDGIPVDLEGMAEGETIVLDSNGDLVPGAAGAAIVINKTLTGSGTTESNLGYSPDFAFGAGSEEYKKTDGLLTGSGDLVSEKFVDFELLKQDSDNIYAGGGTFGYWAESKKYVAFFYTTPGDLYLVDKNTLKVVEVSSVTAGTPVFLNDDIIGICTTTDFNLFSVPDLSQIGSVSVAFGSYIGATLGSDGIVYAVSDDTLYKISPDLSVDTETVSLSTSHKTSLSYDATTGTLFVAQNNTAVSNRAEIVAIDVSDGSEIDSSGEIYCGDASKMAISKVEDGRIYFACMAIPISAQKYSQYVFDATDLTNLLYTGTALSPAQMGSSVISDGHLYSTLYNGSNTVNMAKMSLPGITQNLTGGRVALSPRSSDITTAEGRHSFENYAQAYKATHDRRYGDTLRLQHNAQAQISTGFGTDSVEIVTEHFLDVTETAHLHNIVLVGNVVGTNDNVMKKRAGCVGYDWFDSGALETVIDDISDTAYGIDAGGISITVSAPATSGDDRGRIRILVSFVKVSVPTAFTVDISILVEGTILKNGASVA